MIADAVGEVDWQRVLEAWLLQSGCRAAGSTKLSGRRGDVSPGPAAPPDESDEDELSPLEVLRGEVEDRFAAEGWTPCHAAAADFDGRFVVFPGASGTGKSTLSVLLALRGHAVADELVLLREAGGDVEAVVPPLPLTVTEETFRRLPEAAPWRAGQEHPPDGKVIVKPPALFGRPGRVAAVVLLGQRGKQACKVSLARAPRQEVAKVLLANVVHYSGGGAEYAGARRRTWATLCALLDRAPTYALRGDLLSDGGARVDLMGDLMADSIENVVRGG